MYGSNLIKSCLQRVRLWIHEIFYGFTYGLNNGILSRSHSPLFFIRTVSNGKHQVLKAAFWWKGSVYMIRKSQWNSGLSSVFSTLVVGENAEMATVFLSYVSQFIGLYGSGQQYLCECHGSFRVLCFVLGCIWQRCRSKEQPCNSLGVCFNTCDAKKSLEIDVSQNILFFWSPQGNLFLLVSTIIISILDPLVMLSLLKHCGVSFCLYTY